MQPSQQADIALMTGFADLAAAATAARDMPPSVPMALATLVEVEGSSYRQPGARLLVDAEGRILAAGRGVLELTGWGDAELLGRDVREAFGFSGFADGRDPVALTLEWGVRRLGEQCDIVARSRNSKPVVADFFPAYDDDGGLLVALSPRLTA